jgi:hypothetical protein
LHVAASCTQLLRQCESTKEVTLHVIPCAGSLAEPATSLMWLCRLYLAHTRPMQIVQTIAHLCAAHCTRQDASKLRAHTAPRPGVDEHNEWAFICVKLCVWFGAL